MSKLVDPIKLLRAKINHREEASKSETASAVSYEIPLVPPIGARTIRLTIASTYRSPIPVIFDPDTRTTYPLSVE